MDFEILGRENIQMERRGTNVLKHENIKYLVVILRGISYNLSGTSKIGD